MLHSLRRPTVLVLGTVLLLTGCASLDDATRREALPSAPVTREPLPAAVAEVRVPEEYRGAVLRARPAALLPLSDVPTTGTVRDLVTGQDLAVSGEPPAETVGPVLGGVPTAASAFSGRTRVATELGRTVVGAAWTVEFWVRAGPCGTSWGRLAGTTAGDPDRSGLDVLRYPEGALHACGIGAEVWRDDRFAGGCWTPGPVVGDTWQHVAVVRHSTVLRCYLDGQLVGEGEIGREPVPVPAPFTVASTGTGYGGQLDGAGLAWFALYDRPLALPVLELHAALGRR